ncbi:hypothetical protein TSUD_119980 [Trifolium subterraneum]|uniref:DUF295 domain-containing protein n=1 Tax=Trifolium subterraneum TaxID=3900 RepID=A0A2Z6NR71_TRISU|nr:hypothetical protein TSUD_119980 [Trifolium subterraneum]
MEKRQRVEWLHLPTELWTMIAKHLILEDKTSFDVFRFRSICKTWRSAHPLPQHTPFAPQVCIPLGRRGKCFLLQTTIYRLKPLLHDAPNNTNQSSSKGWLIMLGESESVPLRLLNPFACYPVSNNSQAQILSSDDTLPRVLNFMNFKVVKLLEAFNLSSKYHRTNKVVLFPSSFPVEGRMVNKESGRWQVAKNLGDFAFVLGRDSNFSLSAQDYHGIKGNCIYFSYYLSNTSRVFRFSLKDSMLTTPGPFWPCPNLFKKT